MSVASRLSGRKGVVKALAPVWPIQAFLLRQALGEHRFVRGDPGKRSDDSELFRQMGYISTPATRSGVRTHNTANIVTYTATTQKSAGPTKDRLDQREPCHGVRAPRKANVDDAHPPPFKII